MRAILYLVLEARRIVVGISQHHDYERWSKRQFRGWLCRNMDMDMVANSRQGGREIIDFEVMLFGW